MKKVFPLALLLLLATWGGTSWLISNQVEKHYEQAIGQANTRLRQALPFFEVAPTRFDKGLFKSTAQSRITLHGEAEDEGIPLTHVIYHGPVMFTPMGIKTGSSYIVTTLDLDALPAERRAVLARAAGGKPPLTIGLRTGTGEAFDLDLEVAPLTATGDDGQSEIHFAGLHGALSSDLEGRYLHGKIESGRLRLTRSGNEGVEIAPTTIELDIDELYRGIILAGDARITTQGITVTLPQQGEAHAGNIRLLSSNRHQPDHGIHGEDSLEARPLALKLPARHLEIDDGALRLDLALQGIDAEKYKKLIDAGAALQALQIEAVEKGNTDPALLERNIQNYLASLVGLLGPGLAAETAFDFSLPQGAAKATLALTYADDRPVTELATLRDLIGALGGRFDVTVDEALLDILSLRELATVPVAMGFAVQKDGRLQADIRLDGGVLRINGQPTPFIEMLGPILDEPSPLQRLGDRQPV